MRDLIIVGAGPAGITAAVYASRKKMDILVITEDIGGQTAYSGEIGNYIGYQFISGPELADKFHENMRQYEIAVQEPKKVTLVRKEGQLIKVRADKAEYQAKAVIIASGKQSKELNIPGEREFKNKGLTYCATCDGPLFAGKVVAIIGGGNSALDAGLQMKKIAKHIYIINNSSSLSADAIMRQKIQDAKNVTLWNNTWVSAVLGDKFVNGLEIIRQDKKELLAVEGVFVEIGLIPNSGFVPDVEKNQFAEIKVNSRNETNIPGIFAAGDVTDVTQKQIIIAAGEGAKACLSVFEYLSQQKI